MQNLNTSLTFQFQNFEYSISPEINYGKDSPIAKNLWKQQNLSLPRPHARVEMWG